ncbi:TPA: hypothetical protein ACSTL5_002570, partial [Serratia fonticola]
ECKISYFCAFCYKPMQNPIFTARPLRSWFPSSFSSRPTYAELITTPQTPEQQHYAFCHQSGTENYIQMQQQLYCHADSPLKHLAWHIDCHEIEKPASLEEVDWS